MNGYEVGDRFILPEADGVEWYEIIGVDKDKENVTASPRNSGLLCGFSSGYLRKRAVLFDEALSMIEDAVGNPTTDNDIVPKHGVHWSEVKVGDHLWVDDSYLVQVDSIDSSDFAGGCTFRTTTEGWIADSRLKGVVFDD